jgi:hypothetical protein
LGWFVLATQHSSLSELGAGFKSGLDCIPNPDFKFQSRGGSLRRSFDSIAHFNENVWRFDFEAEHRDESGRD